MLFGASFGCGGRQRRRAPGPGAGAGAHLAVLALDHVQQVPGVERDGRLEVVHGVEQVVLGRVGVLGEVRPPDALRDQVPLLLRHPLLHALCSAGAERAGLRRGEEGEGGVEASVTRPPPASPPPR